MNIHVFSRSYLGIKKPAPQVELVFSFQPDFISDFFYFGATL